MNSSICSRRIVESFQWGNLQPFREFQGIAKMRTTDEQEYAIRSQLKWRRDGADWILMHGRRRLGLVVPDNRYPGLFRSVKSQGLSDVSNLSRAKDSVLAAAIRDLAWDAAIEPRSLKLDGPGPLGAPITRATAAFRLGCAVFSLLAANR